MDSNEKFRSIDAAWRELAGELNAQSADLEVARIAFYAGATVCFGLMSEFALHRDKRIVRSISADLRAAANDIATRPGHGTALAAIHRILLE